MRTERLFDTTAIAVSLLLYSGILTLWAPQNWSVGLFRLGAFFIGLLGVIAIGLYGPPVRRKPVMFALAAAVVWPLAQLGLDRSIYRWETIDSFWMWTTNFVLFFATFQFCVDRGRTRRFLLGFLCFAAVLSVLSTVQMFTSNGKVFWLFPTGYTDYVLGPFVYRNQYAAFIELALPVALSFALFAEKNRPVFAGIAAVMVASVAASASRAGAILVALEAVAVPLLALRMGLASRKAAASMFANTVALTIISGLVVGFGALWEHLLSPDPYFLRREVLTSGLRMVTDHPWVGFGLGTWTVAYPAYAIFDPGAVINQAHNDWLQWTVEGGLPFVVCMIVFALLLVRPAVRSLWGIGILAVLAHCFIDYPLNQRPAFAALFFALCGAVCGASVNSRGKQEHFRETGQVHLDRGDQCSVTATN